MAMDLLKGEAGDLFENGNAPKQQKMRNSEAGRCIGGILNEMKTVHIEQKVGLLEAVTGGALEQANQYKVSAEKDGEVIFTTKESSKFCTRNCCAPNHSTMMYVYNGAGPPESPDVLLTIERQGCECCSCPKRCLGSGCPLCMDCCKDGINVYEGFVEGRPGELEGDPKPLMTIEQPCLGGKYGCKPQLMLYPDGNRDAGHSEFIQGPCIFGGCTEMCCVSTYKHMTKDEKDIGEIVHLTPKTIGEACAAICTDADHMEINWEDTATQDQKVTTLASLFLVDYMFFEMDNGMVACKDSKQLDITCCFMFCCGSLYPCKCTLKKSETEGSTE